MGVVQIERLGTGQHSHMFKNIYIPTPPEKSGVENTPPKKRPSKKGYKTD